MNSEYKTIIISDIHLSTKHLCQNGYAAISLAQIKRTIRLLEQIEQDSSVDTIILLGDILDPWACPVHVQPPNYEAILADNADFVTILKRIQQNGIKVVYCIGNHDYDISQSIIDSFMLGVEITNKYYKHGIYCIHGDEFDSLFTGPDYITDPVNGLSLGYYLTRIVSTTPRTGRSIIDIASYFDDIFEALVTSQNIFESIIEAVAELTDLSDDDIIILPDNDTISITEIKQRYGCLRSRYTNSQILTNLKDRFSLGQKADKLCKQSDINVVVMGHIHRAKIDKDTWFVDDCIYVNTGALCEEDAHFVSIEHTANRLLVNLNKIDDSGLIISSSSEEIEI